ncbi:uncharacterized protein LOC124943936 [Impatiens glandulifera]|uniref:uncharacterized protein LOC124943936 n=1 Tax=Impatiens glandulifera TaxID=253017 RepID=UPI001FB0DB7D|nr:uncharacterized protein LOC124943936 [Impatiens glandulifera]
MIDERSILEKRTFGTITEEITSLKTEEKREERKRKKRYVLPEKEQQREHLQLAFNIANLWNYGGFPLSSKCATKVAIFGSQKQIRENWWRVIAGEDGVDGSFISITAVAVAVAGTALQQEQQKPTPQLIAVNHRPAVILPGLGNNTSDYKNLEIILNDYGIQTVVAKVSRIDWLRNAAGLVDPNYWRGTLRPRPVLDWYLKRVDEAVCEAKELAQGGTLSLVGHSAGGWLARVYMEEYETASRVSLLLTLGTPHLPAPKGIPGVIDQTRGLLNYVEKNCSKPVYTPELRYVCVAGRYLQGARLFGNSDVEVDMVPKPVPTFRERFVGQGYKQVCGEANVWGDGIVPETWAHLEGAMNISLDGVYHSPVGSDELSRPWYGSPTVVEQWVQYLLH